MAFGKNSKRKELVNSDIIRQFYKNNNKCDHIYNDMIIFHMNLTLKILLRKIL